MKYYIEYNGYYYPISHTHLWTKVKHRAKGFDSLEEANKRFEELGISDLDLAKVVKEEDCKFI